MSNPAKRIRARRETLGLTQRELADRVGTTQSDVARMEAGRRADPHISTLERYARALECPVGDLL